MSDPLPCPACGEPCDRDSVDIGVGVQYGPWFCPACYWSEVDVEQVEKDNPGWYCDPSGAMYRVDAIVEKCERLGLDGDTVRKAFDRNNEDEHGG